MRRTLRRFLYFFSAVAWLLVLGAGLEVYERIHVGFVEKAAEAYGDPLMAAAFRADDAIIKATPAEALPPEVKRYLPSRDGFATRDEEGRLRLARERGELIAVCDPAGAVLAAYVSPEPEEIAQLGRAVRVGKPIFTVLPPAEAADARNAFGQVFNADFQPPHEYTVPLPGGEPFCAEFSFVALKDVPSQGQVAVFVRGSMWKIMWKRFREHIYVNNFYDRWPNSEFWTNAQGFRSHEIVLPKPPGVYRIACVGGSTTVEGPRNELTYPAMLERKLREHFRTDRIDVVNCGAYTVDTGREVELFRDFLALEPDLIVQYNFVNDVAAGLPNWMAPEGLFADPGKTIKAWLRRLAFVHRRFNWWLLPSEEELTRRIEELPIANLREECRLAQAAGVAMAIGSFARPDVEHLDAREVDYFYCRSHKLWGWSVDTRSYARMVDIYNRLVRQLCEEQGVRYIPIAENVTGGVSSFTDICHMHLNAMERKADVVFDAVKDVVAAKLGTPAAAPATN